MPTLFDIGSQIFLGWLIGFIVSAALALPFVSVRVVKQFTGAGADIRCS